MKTEEGGIGRNIKYFLLYTNKSGLFGVILFVFSNET